MLDKSLDDAEPRELEEAWKYCAGIARRAAGNFYYAFLFLPRELRRGIYALYAFLRAGDDAADNGDGGSRQLLKKLRRGLDLVFAGRYCDRLTLALAHAHRRFVFPREHFDEMFRGLQMDLSVKRYPTFEDLRLYCYRVASTVGLLCLPIFGADTPEARCYAENLGIGMQLTNILRDLWEDLQRGRIYLPAEDLNRFELHESEIFAASQASKLRDLVLWEARRAEHFFREAEKWFPADLKAKLAVAQIMGAIYKTILDKIIAAERFDRCIELNRREKLNIGYRVVSELGGL